MYCDKYHTLLTQHVPISICRIHSVQTGWLYHSFIDTHKLNHVGLHKLSTM